MNTDNVLRYLSDATTYQSNWSNGAIKTNYRTSAEEFLGYAQRDLDHEHPYGTINCLSNLRRAVGCQIDRILTLLGYRNITPGVHQMKFKSKAKLLDSYGVPISQELRKGINRRNEVEHFYKHPVLSEVKEFLYHVELFINSTFFYTNNFPPVVQYSNHQKQIEYNFYNLTLFVNQGEGCLYLDNGSEKLKIKRDDRVYIDVFRYHLKQTLTHSSIGSVLRSLGTI